METGNLRDDASKKKDERETGIVTSINVFKFNVTIEI